MRALIIEDENLAALRLEKMVKEVDENIQIVDVLESVEESVSWFKENQEPDILFLDIHLEDDLSFAIFDQVNINCPVIFTTAYDEYAIKAFKLKSIDYLLKPIEKEDLEHALKKYREMSHTTDNQVNMQDLYNMIVNKEPLYRERFSVSLGSKIKTFMIDEVAYFLSENKYTSACLFDRSSYPLDSSLDKLSKEIDPKKFFRINRQLLVNINAIEEIHIYPKSRLKLDLKPPLEKGAFVSLDKVTNFKTWIGVKNPKD